MSLVEKSLKQKIEHDLSELKKSLDYNLISKEEYEKHKKELEEKLSKLPPEKTKQAPPSFSKSSDKSLVIIIVVLVLLVGGVFFGIKNMNVNNRPLTIDELNELNFAGKLKPDQGYLYKGIYSFVFYDGLWYTQVGTRTGTTQFNVPLHYGPRDLEDINIEGVLNITLFNASDEVYMTFNPLDPNLQYIALSIGEFDQSLIRAFGKTPVAACVVNETLACSSRPIIDCDNTDKPVVLMKDDIETKVVLQNNCMVIQGRANEIVRATDRVLLALYNIMT